MDQRTKEDRKVYKMEEILSRYYENNAAKLRRMVDGILVRFGGLSNQDMDDFYSLANEVFVDVLKRYDGSLVFESFLYSCLSNRMKTEMTSRNREKRRADRLSVPIDMPVGDEEGYTLGDTLADSFDLEGALLEDKEEGYSPKVERYLGKLSQLQKEVLWLDIAGYLPNEIKAQLQIDEKRYADCYAAIHSYRNISVLF